MSTKPGRYRTLEPSADHQARQLSPTEAAQAMLTEAGKQIEIAAFDLAPLLTAAECGRLIEVAAYVQCFEPSMLKRRS
ncbi:MAG: hypothetical protein ACK5II_00540 [Paracoccus sp. (in: a-proteobacteria)]